MHFRLLSLENKYLGIPSAHPVYICVFSPNQLTRAPVASLIAQGNTKDSSICTYSRRNGTLYKVTSV